MHTQNPITWVFAQFQAMETLGSDSEAQYFDDTRGGQPWPRQIGAANVWRALRLGWQDAAASRTDLLILWVIYPVMVAYIWAADYYGALVPLLLPVLSGFALLGPLFAVGFYEMSRRREAYGEMHWTDGFKVLRSPGIFAIVGLGLMLVALFAAWLAVATLITRTCLGPDVPLSWGGFFAAAFTTLAGWEMLGLGVLAGAAFAALALTVSSVSFPLLLDRPVSLGAALRASLQAIRLNPGPLLLWGAIVAGLLALGSIPAFAGLIVVLPILGHGTWHLYRAMLPR